MRNFLVPFQLTPQGNVATTSNPDTISRQRVNSLIGTTLGGRVMLPEYGTSIPHHVFDPGLGLTADEMVTDLTNQIQTWEPTINVLDVTVDETSADQGVLTIGVQFTTSNDPTFTPVLTATVLVGGTVVNTNSGVNQ